MSARLRLVLRVCLLVGPAVVAAPSQQPAQQPTLPPASVSGVVRDVGGTAVEGATVTLLPNAGEARTTTTEVDGSFHFDNVPAGPYSLTVTADGLADATLPGVLAAGERQQLPDIALRVPPVTQNVDAMSQVQMADLQIKQEETQRLFGMLPNFYVSYDPNFVPLTPRQKYRLALHTIVDPVDVGVVGLTAGVEQARNSFAGYGQGASGYGKRLGAGFADFSIGALLGGATLPVLFHQDPRYFYKGTGSIGSRLRYVLWTTVVSKGDNGKWQPAYASILGSFASGAISNIYYPASDRNGAALTFRNGGLAVVSDGIANFMQEFLLKHLTPRTLKTPPNP